MKKNFIRIAALLLLPCLVGHAFPMGAAPFQNCKTALLTVHPTLSRPFQTQALSARLTMELNTEKPTDTLAGIRVRRMAMLETTAAAQQIEDLYPRKDDPGVMSQMLEVLKDLPGQDDAKGGHTEKLLNLIWGLIKQKPLYLEYDADVFLEALRANGMAAVDVFAEVLKANGTIIGGVHQMAFEFAYAHVRVFRQAWEMATEGDRIELARVFKDFASQAIDAFASSYMDYHRMDWNEDSRPDMKDFVGFHFRRAFYAAHYLHDSLALRTGELLAMVPPAKPNRYRIPSRSEINVGSPGTELEFAL